MGRLTRRLRLGLFGIGWFCGLDRRRRLSRFVFCLGAGSLHRSCSAFIQQTGFCLLQFGNDLGFFREVHECCLHRAIGRTYFESLSIGEHVIPVGRLLAELHHAGVPLERRNEIADRSFLMIHNLG